MPLLTITPPDLAQALSISHSALQSTGYLSPKEIAELISHIQHNFELCVHQPDRHIFLKCAQQDELQGVILLKDFWNLAELYVAPQAQGKGVGAALLQAALERCRGRSPRGHVRTNASANAVAFYRAFGFVDFPLDRPLPYGCVPLVYPL